MFTLISASLLIILGFTVKVFLKDELNPTAYVNTYIVLIFIGVVLFIRVMWVIAVRIRFCSRLKKMCKEKGYAYNKCNSPVKAFFKVYGGEDIVISRREKVIRLKFFPGFTSKWFIHIENERKARFYKRFIFVGVNIKGRAQGGNFLGGKGSISSDGLFGYNKRIDLSFSKDNYENIVIISPKCNDMTIVEGNSKQTVGSGIAYGKSKLYYQKDFPNYFDRM